MRQLEHKENCVIDCSSSCASTRLLIVCHFWIALIWSSVIFLRSFSNHRRPHTPHACPYSSSKNVDLKREMDFFHLFVQFSFGDLMTSHRLSRVIVMRGPAGVWRFLSLLDKSYELESTIRYDYINITFIFIYLELHESLRTISTRGRGSFGVPRLLSLVHHTSFLFNVITVGRRLRSL